MSFRRLSASSCLLVAALLAADTVPAAELPAPSKERARLTEELRSKIRGAESRRIAGDSAGARTLYLQVVEQAERFAEPPLFLAQAVDGLADLHREAGEWAEADGYYVRAAALWERLLGPDQPRLAVSLHNLASVRMARGDLRGAEAPLRRALDIFERSLGTDSDEARNSRRAAAELERRLRRGASTQAVR